MTSDETLNERCAMLKEAVANSRYVHCKYRHDPWVDHHGRVESYEGNDGRPFVVFCGRDRRVYIRDIISLEFMFRPDGKGGWIRQRNDIDSELKLHEDIPF